MVLLRELRERGYRGGYTTLKDYLQPKREAARATAVRRFETPPGPAGASGLGHLGTGGEERKLSGFTFTLGYSRMMMAEATLDQKLSTVLRLHEDAFRQLAGLPEEILYDRMKTVWLAVDERGEIVWNPATSAVLRSSYVDSPIPGALMLFAGVSNIFVATLNILLRLLNDGRG
jgi:transposase